MFSKRPQLLAGLAVTLAALASACAPAEKPATAPGNEAAGPTQPKAAQASAVTTEKAGASLTQDPDPAPAKTAAPARVQNAGPVVAQLATPLAAAVAGPPAGPPALSPGTPNADDGTRQADLVIDTYNKFPEDMRNLSKEQVLKVHNQVATILTQGQAFLRKYPEHERRAQVLYVVSRVLSLNLQRFILELGKDWKNKHPGTRPPAGYINAKRDEYIENILQMVEEGLLLESNDDGKRDLHKVKGYALFVGGRPGEASIVWRRLLNRFPLDPDLDQTSTSLITSLLRSAESSSRELADADYRIVVDECDSFLGRFPKSSFLPTILNVRGKALTQGGNMNAALSHWDRFQSFLSPTPGSAADKRDYDRVEERVGFNKGFCHYANGDAAKALEVWKQYLKELAQRQAEGRLSQVGQVYRGRTERLVRTLENLQGRPAPLLEVASWVNDQAFKVKDQKGKVTAIFLSPYNTKRSFPFARALAKFHQENWHLGFRATMVCFSKGSREGQMQLVAAERQSLGITYPVGMDTTSERVTYKRYNAAVGSATIVVIDRAGNLAWYKMDPTERDIELARKVYERLLADQ